MYETEIIIVFEKAQPGYDDANITVVDTYKGRKGEQKRPVGIQVRGEGQLLPSGCVVAAVVEVDEPKSDRTHVKVLYRNFEAIMDNDAFDSVIRQLYLSK